MVTVENIVLIFMYVICNVPSIPLYIATVFVIIKNWKTMKSSFFLLYLCDFSMNLSTAFFTFITLKLSGFTCETCLLSPLYNWLQDTIISNFLYAMMYHMSYIQYATTALISLNRLTIIYDHYSWEKIWRKYFIIPMLFIVLLPLISTGKLFVASCQWGFKAEGRTFVLRCKSDTTALYTPLIVFQVVCIFLSIVFNATSLYLIGRASAEMRQKSETNFIILISVTVLVQSMGTTISVALNGAETSDWTDKLHSYLLPVISDAITLVHPWLLVLLSKPIRRHISWDVFRQRTASVDVVPHVNSLVGQHQHQMNQHAPTATSRSTIKNHN